VERCERELERLTRERAHIEAALAAPGIYDEGARAQLRELLARQAALAQQIEAAEGAWLAASDRLESRQPRGLA
jgi:ATP-binding cassette, subfamily F, member 3